MRRIGGGSAVNLDDVAWKNRSAEVVEYLECVVPKEVRDIVRSANTVLPKDEFSFLLKCDIDWDAGVVYIDPKDVYFPEQIVTPVSVNYLEDKPEYNGVMHKHPGQMKNFSGTDKEWINQNFQVSILWIDDQFCNGVVNVPSKAGRIQLPIKVYDEPDFVVNEEVVEAVKTKVKRPAVQTVVFGKGSQPSQQSNLPDFTFPGNKQMTNLDEKDDLQAIMDDDPFAYFG